MVNIITNKELDLYTLLSWFEIKSLSSTTNLNKYMGRVYEIIGLIGLNQFNILKDIARHKLGTDNPKYSKSSLNLKQLIELFKALWEHEYGGFDLYVNNEKYETIELKDLGIDKKVPIKSKIKDLLLDWYEVEGIIINLEEIWPEGRSNTKKENIIYEARREVVSDRLQQAYKFKNLTNRQSQSMDDLRHIYREKREGRREKTNYREPLENKIIWWLSEKMGSSPKPTKNKLLLSA